MRFNCETTADTDWILAFIAEKGGDPEIIRESQRRRFGDVSLVDKILALDAEWRDGELRLIVMSALLSRCLCIQPLRVVQDCSGSC